MRKNIKKCCTIFLVSLLTLSMLAACGSSGGTASNTGTTTSNAGSESAGAPADGAEPHHIVMALIGPSEQPNQAEVFKAASDLALQEIGMTVEYTLMGFGDYQQKTNLMLSGGDKLDILPIYFANANSYINAKQIVNLGDYIYEHGKDILDYMGEDVATSGNMNGFIYGIPANKESSSQAGIVMRKDIVEALNIDVASLKSPWDLTAVFEKVKAAYPNLDCIAGNQILYKIETHDPLFDDFGALLDNGQVTTVTNWYESDEYRDRAILLQDWYKAGYVKLDAATSTETAQNLVKAGTLFSYVSAIKPGFLIQEDVSCGMEMVTQYLGDKDGNKVANLWTNAVNFFNWGIAHQSTDKVKSMQFLNWAYSSPEWNNLMNFGIEGTDYVKVSGSETLIDYPDGKDAGSAYHMNMGWMYPNQFIGYIWNGQPEDVWQQYRDFNAEALKSKAFGFMYDSSSVSTELAALNSVKEEYYKAIETGSVSNVDETLKVFNEKLYAAGLQKVMDLKQQQLDEWLAKQ